MIIVSHTLPVYQATFYKDNTTINKSHPHFFHK